MNCKELMVGDWVNVNGLNLKVGAIHADEIGVVDPDYKIYWCSDDEFDRIDPIPLTEEILVKNGFGMVNNQYFFGQVEIKELRDCWVVTINKKDADIDINIHYVHELQHLLRLCGIEKEIEL